MCGIWGFSGKFNADQLRAIIELADERGGHSFGVYGIHKSGRHLVFKADGRADPDTILQLLEGCIIGVGQSRLATSGDRSMRSTQPVYDKKGVAVHNGHIHDLDKVARGFGYDQSPDLDSEVILGLHVEQDPMTKKAFHRRAGEIGDSAYIYLHLPTRQIISYSKKNPLYTNEGEIAECTYWCSKEWQQQNS